MIPDHPETVFVWKHVQCQDQFFFMHGGLFGARQRLYDVPVAVDVLVNGRYPWLPKGIEYCGGDVDPRPIVDVSFGAQSGRSNA